jgi:cytoskeleton protein RodZ
MEQDQITATEPNKPATVLAWSGQRLRQAREASGLSQLDVAQRLHLNVNLIQALEDNNKEALPAQIYLVGYLRSYARLLNLPADRIIDAAQVEPQPTATLLPENIDYRPRGHTISRFALIGILVILCLLAGWWVISLGPEWLPRWFPVAAVGSNFPSISV